MSEKKQKFFERILPEPKNPEPPSNTPLIKEKVSDSEEKKDYKLLTIEEKLKLGFEKYTLSLHSTILFLLCLELLLSFLLLLLLYSFSIILALPMIWIFILVVLIYCASHCLISRFTVFFRKSASTFLICIIFAICEAIVLCFVSMLTTAKVLMIEIFMIILSLFNAGVLSKCLKKKYNEKAGLWMALMTTAIIYIIFFFTNQDIRMIMTVCTLLVCGYEWFLIFKVSAVVRVLEENLEQNKFQTSLFASMLMYKAKIDLIGLGIQTCYLKCWKSKDPSIQV